MASKPGLVKQPHVSGYYVHYEPFIGVVKLSEHYLNIDCQRQYPSGLYGPYATLVECTIKSHQERVKIERRGSRLLRE